MSVIDLPDETATEALAARLSAIAEPGDVIALKGELGAGKTSFARAFIRAFIQARGRPDETVPSPTFTLVQRYDVGDAAIWHFDCYRLERPEDAWELGIEEAYEGGISLIEWPERLGRLLPRRRLEITLTQGETPNARRAWLDPSPAWSARIAEFAANG